MPDWQFSQVGSRTVWSPVKNLFLSVDLMYNNVQSANAYRRRDCHGLRSGLAAGHVPRAAELLALIG